MQERADKYLLQNLKKQFDFSYFTPGITEYPGNQFVKSKLFSPVTPESTETVGIRRFWDILERLVRK